MSAQHTPAPKPDWAAMARELDQSVDAVQREYFTLGKVRPETMRRMEIALANAETDLAIDDAKTTRTTS